MTEMSSLRQVVPEVVGMVVVEQNNVILRSFQLTFVFIQIHDSVEEYILRQTDPETTLTAAYVCCQDNTDYFKIQWVLKRYGGREYFSHHNKSAKGAVTCKDSQ